MTYHDHSHRIKTNAYKLAKNEDINLKNSGYDRRGELRFLRKPNPS